MKSLNKRGRQMTASGIKKQTQDEKDMIERHFSN